MNTFEIQMERAHQSAKARAAADDLVESLRVVNSLTRAMMDDDSGTVHADVVEVDTLHVDAQYLAGRVIRLDSGCQAAGLPGAEPALPERK